ncbi:MAG: cupin domain-containing protein [Deltaproteobacteria bacterium]|nr:cupin domain-containing protein [Deltaproteobacteria bacterium]
MNVSNNGREKIVQIAPGRWRRILHTDSLLMAVIDFEDGPASAPDPPHSHPHEQVTFVAAGEVLFFIDEEFRRLGPGDMVAVPPDRPHRIQLLTPYVRLVDTFTPLRQDFL